MSVIRIIHWTKVLYSSDQYDHMTVTLQSVAVILEGLKNLRPMIKYLLCCLFVYFFVIPVN